MTFLKSLVRSWLPVGVAFLLGATFVGIAGAHSGFPEFLHSGHSDTMNGTLTAKNFKYKTPKTNKLVVPGAAFVGDTNTSVIDHGNYSGQVFLPAGNVANAPVNLPHGAVVTKVSWFHDTAAAGDAELHLEANTATGGHDDMVAPSNAACAATPCVTVVTTVSPNVINNGLRHYGIFLSANNDFTTYKVVIFYTTRLPGPATGLPSGPGISRPGATAANSHN